MRPRPYDGVIADDRWLTMPRLSFRLAHSGAQRDGDPQLTARQPRWRINLVICLVLADCADAGRDPRARR